MEIGSFIYKINAGVKGLTTALETLNGALPAFRHVI